MDISNFYDSTLDIKKWINQSLNSGRAPTDSTADHLNRLIGDLQYQYESKDLEFENTGTDALACMVNVLCEVERVGEESKKVQKQIEHFYVSLAKIEKEASHSIYLLAEIDAVKDRMEKCFSSLHSAELLLQSNTKLEKMKESTDVFSVAKQIEEMKQNLAVLGNLPQFNDTEIQLQELEKKLEGMALPLLQNALTERDGEEIRAVIGLFQQMDGERELDAYIIDYYVQEIASHWTKFTEKMQEGNSTFPVAIGDFYGHFIDVINKHVRWGNKILPQRQLFSKVIMKAVEKTFSSFHSFLQQLVDAGDSCSIHLIEIWNITVHFASQITEIISPLSLEEKKDLLLSIFSPFSSFQSHFDHVMSKRLLFEFNNSIIMKPVEFSQTILWIEERIPRLFYLCEETTMECILFTGGLGAEEYIASLSETLVSFLTNWLEILQFLRVESKVDIMESESKEHESLTAYDQSFSKDWPFVQGALQVLRSTKLFSKKFNTLESFLRNKFITQGNFLLDEVEEKDCDSLFFQVKAREHPEKVIKFQERLCDVAFQLLPLPHRMFITFDTRVQSFVFDTMFQFIREKLETVPKLKNWSKIQQSSSFGIEMPSFSLSPLGYITQIGEHLYALPQQLAPFASGELEEEDEDVDFVAQWLDHISSNTMSLYVQRICQISSLSPSGQNQLVTDIEYLCEVLQPFGIEVDRAISATLEYLKMNENE